MAKRVDWTDEQNRIIVEAYFQMLHLQQAGEPYVKAQYVRRVEEQTGRTSLDYKFQNISFLLQEMGHPTITGYKPAPNTQRGTLYQAISRHLQTTQYPLSFRYIEDDVDKTQAEEAVAPHCLGERNRQHGRGQRIGHLIFHHLRRLAGIVRLYDHLYVRQIWNCVYRN